MGTFGQKIAHNRSEWSPLKPPSTSAQRFPHRRLQHPLKAALNVGLTATAKCGQICAEDGLKVPLNSTLNIGLNAPLKVTAKYGQMGAEDDLEVSAKIWPKCRHIRAEDGLRVTKAGPR
jgi:hypothetical protein